MPKVKKVIYPNDCVKIVKPEVFVRVGYPLTLEDIRKKFITADKRNKLAVFLHEEFVIDAGIRTWQGLPTKLENEIAYLILKKEGFGGNKREIHTKTEKSIFNKTCKVVDKRYVLTGNYCHGCYYGEEYEPAYLENVKRHTILKLNVFDSDPFGFMTTIMEPFEIEDINVEKL